MAAVTPAGRPDEGGPSLPGLLRRLQHLAKAYAALVVVDARHAVHQIVELVCIAIVATVLGVTAWLAFVVAVAGWLFDGGANWQTVLACAALLNVAGAGAAAWWLWRQLHDSPPLAATLRQIEGEAPGEHP